MTTERAYEKFLLKTESNISNNNIATDRGRFILLFNEAQNRFIEWTLEKRNEDDILQLKQLLVVGHELNEKTVDTERTHFELPSNYFSYSTVLGKGKETGGECIDQDISLFQIKPENASELLQDEYNKPSFKYREAPFFYSSEGVSIYKGDIDFSKLLISYYRKPIQIRLINEDNVEEGFNETYPPELSDQLTDRVISAAASDSDLNANNNRFQAQKQRAITEI